MEILIALFIGFFIFSLDENEMPDEIRELWLDHAKRNVIDS